MSSAGSPPETLEGATSFDELFAASLSKKQNDWFYYDITTEDGHTHDLTPKILAMIMHDVKSPLSTIQLCLEIITALTKTNTCEDKLVQAIRRAKTNASRVQRLADEVLLLEKIKAGTIKLDLAELNLQSVINECIDTLKPHAQERDVEINVKNVDRKLFADRTRLGQILQNLVGNAISFAPSGSSVNIVSKRCQIDGRDYVRVSVEDSGPGIPKAMHAEVFRAYQQASGAELRSGSYGLGLAICDQLVALHNGKIWVDDRDDGQGCVFHFALPTRKSN